MIRYLKIHGSKGWKPKQYCGACEDVTDEVAKIKAFMKKSATEHVKTAFLYSEAKRELSEFKDDVKDKLLDSHAVKCMILRGTIKLPAEYVDSSIVESNRIDRLKKGDAVKVSGTNAMGKVTGFNMQGQVVIEFGFSSLSFNREAVRLINIDKPIKT